MLTLKEAEKKSGKSERMLRRMIKLDKLPAQMINGQYMIAESDLQTLPRRKSDKPVEDVASSPAPAVLEPEKRDEVASTIYGYAMRTHEGTLKWDDFKARLFAVPGILAPAVNFQ